MPRLPTHALVIPVLSHCNKIGCIRWSLPIAIDSNAVVGLIDSIPSMTTLRIELFQQLTLSLGNGETVDLGSPTTKALFAYLVLHGDQPLDRRRLAFLFWPNTGESVSRRNLRQYLHRIRRALEPIDPANELMVSDGATVSLSIPADWWIDVVAFEAVATPPRQDLPKAVALYRGDLLEEVYEEWVQGERDRLRRLYLECLLKLIEELTTQAHYTQAIQVAQQYLRAEPYVESAHLRLMGLFHALGDRNRVKQQYEHLTTLLADEFGAPPLPETTVAYHQMMRGGYSLNGGKRGPERTFPGAAPLVTDATPAALPKPPLGDLPAQSQLVGREAELALLQQGYQAAQNAIGTLILLQGELGIGKSRLIADWLAQLPATPYRLLGRGHEFEGMIAYAPVIQALASVERLPWELFQPPPPWLAPLTPLLPTLADHFPHLATTAAATQFHAIQCLGYFLLTLARQRPLVLVLDNLHWADPATWHFLTYMVQQIQHTQILIVGALRTEDVSAENQRLVRRLQAQPWVQLHTLPRLSLVATTQLAQQLLPTAQTEPRLLQRLYLETEGNPFFLIETIRALQEAGDHWQTWLPTDALGQRSTFAIPFKIQTVIGARLDQLGEESRLALSVAAAIGREFTFALLQAICQIETTTLLNMLDEWLRRQLVRETAHGYDFTHEKLSQVAYNGLTRARRQHIHYQIALHLAQQQPPPDPAQLARHYYLSSDPAQALPYLTQAGRRALEVRSYATAREFGLQALSLSGRFPANRDPVARIDLNLQLAQAYAFSNQLDKALDLLQETERITSSVSDHQRLAQICHHSSQLFWLCGRPGSADVYARRTLRYAEELADDGLRLAALRMASRTCIALSHFDDAIAHLLRYIDLAKKMVTPPVGFPVIYGYLGTAYARVGSWERAIDAVERAVQLAEAERTGAIYAVTSMQKAFVYAELREWRAALAAVKPVYHFWQEEEMSPHAFMLRCITGKVLSYLTPAEAAQAMGWVTAGKRDGGAAEIRAALAWAEAVDYRVFRHVGYLFLAQALQATADPAAFDTAVLAGNLAHTAGDHWAHAVALRVQAAVDMRNPHQTRWLQAEEKLLVALELLRQMRARADLAHTYLTLRRLYDRAGQVAWAIDCHFRAITIFEELGMAAEVAAAQGQATSERTGAVVIPGLKLRGPHWQGVG